MIVFNLGAQNCINTQSYTLCSGQNQILEVANYLSGSTFVWSIDGTVKQGHTTNQYVVNETVTSSLVKEFKCEISFSGSKYETDIFIVTIHPFTNPEINATGLCEGNQGTFILNNPQSYKDIAWTLDNSYKSSNDSVTYLCNGNTISVKLDVVNQSGCPSSRLLSFNVKLNPDAWIEKNRLVTDSLYMDNVECGNSVSEYTLRGLKNGMKVNKWSAFNNGQEIKSTNRQFIQEWIVKDDSTLRIKWTKTNTTYEILIRATTFSGGCSFDSEYNTLLIKDYSPDEDILIRKPYQSNVLIFPTGQDKTGLNFYWGVTYPDGKEGKVSNVNKFYVEIPGGIDPSKEYWVETWYSSNRYCRNRTYLTE